LAVGIVGTGGMGTQHLLWLLGDPKFRVSAVCDVDQSHVDAAQAKANEGNGDQACRAFHDFRELCALDDLDVVWVATPDHWHMLVAREALGAGKHVYCEKPLVNSVAEGRELCNAVRASGKVLQCGSHERSGPNARLVADWVREGRLGEVHTVRVFLPCDDPHHNEARARTKAILVDPPAGFDYDFWQGPAAEAPYAENRCHFWWRFNLRYGGGEMTDRGAHIIDLGQMILARDDSGPTEISAQGTRTDGDLYDAFFDFTLDNRYADGIRLIGEKTGPRGLRIEGEKGSIFIHVHGGQLEAEPASLLDREYPGDGNGYALHRDNFYAAIRDGVPLHASAEAAHRTATICHLNNISMRLGRPLKWDPAAEKVVDDEEANRLLTPTFREPWKLS
jgi:predicted dehydrogenase